MLLRKDIVLILHMMKMKSLQVVTIKQINCSLVLYLNRDGIILCKLKKENSNNLINKKGFNISSNIISKLR